MRAIAVDDEEIGLARILRLLQESEYFSYVGGYTEPAKAIENFEGDNVDIAFLDIEMPETNGLMLAELLMQKNPDLEVIFVTAYDKYAIQAFQANAIGYLLKPIEFKDLKENIERILKRRNRQEGTKECQRIFIQTFQYFLVSLDESMKNVIKFRTEKAKELLGLLVNYQGKPLSKDKIIYLLWNDMDIDRATKNFHTTCYYIRKSFENLGIPNLILRKQNGYIVNEDCIVSDLSIFCKAIEEMNKDNPKIQGIKTAFFKYGGYYLGNEDYLWGIEDQSYYEDAFEEMGIFLAEGYEGIGQDNEAEKVLKYLLMVNPLSEKACGKLIELYMKKGDRLSAKKVFSNFEKNMMTK